MKIESVVKVIVTKEEKDILRRAVDVLCDMTRDSAIHNYFRINLPCGYGLGWIRDGITYVFDLVEEE